MRLPGARSVVAAAVLAASIALADGVPRPRDPWVFRSVLDERARMLTVALHEHLYVAYDLQDGTLRRAWPEGVKFSGGVYDARHGPQPTSIGRPYFAADPDTHVWQVRQRGQAVPATFHYLGYQIANDAVTIRFAWDTPGGRVTVDEAPAFVVGDGKVTLSRAIRVNGLAKDQVLSLDLTDSGGEHAEGIADGPVTRQPSPATAATISPTTRPVRLSIDRDGLTTLRTTWSTR